MTNEEFVDSLAVIVTLNIWPADIQSRTLRIIPIHADTDAQAAILIEFSKGVACFRVMMGRLDAAPDCRALWINKLAVPDGRTKAEACGLIESFLAQLNALPRRLAAA